MSLTLFLHTQGNLHFTENAKEELEITDTPALMTIASLLATRPADLEKALCYRVVGNKLGSVEKMHTREQAEYGRDAFAKVWKGGMGGREGGGGGGGGREGGKKREGGREGGRDVTL